MFFHFFVFSFLISGFLAKSSSEDVDLVDRSTGLPGQQPPAARPLELEGSGDRPRPADGAEDEQNEPPLCVILSEDCLGLRTSKNRYDAWTACPNCHGEHAPLRINPHRARDKMICAACAEKYAAWCPRTMVWMNGEVLVRCIGCRAAIPAPPVAAQMKTANTARRWRRLVAAISPPALQFRERVNRVRTFERLARLVCEEARKATIELMAEKRTARQQARQQSLLADRQRVGRAAREERQRRLRKRNLLWGSAGALAAAVCVVSPCGHGPAVACGHGIWVCGQGVWNWFGLGDPNVRTLYSGLGVWIMWKSDA